MDCRASSVGLGRWRGRPWVVAPQTPVSAFDRTLRAVATDLKKLKLRWALVGAVAVAARGVPRFTNDFDFAVAVGDDREAEATVSRMMALGYRLATLLENETTGEIATARLWCRPLGGTQFIVDLLFQTSGLEAEVVAAAQPVTVMPNLRVPVATRGHLIAMKILSVNADRGRDADDLTGLVGVAENSDLEEARAGLRLLAQRDKSRGKDLLADLEAIVARVRPSL